MGNTGLFFVGVAMTCAVLSGMNAFMLSSSRLLYSMSCMKIIPDWFGRLNKATNVPRNAILFVTALSLVAPFCGRQVINWVVDMTSVGASLSFAFACGAALTLARREKSRKWCVVGTMGLMISCFLLCLLLIPGAPGYLSAPSRIALLAWLILGIAMYFFTRSRVADGNCDEQERKEEK